MRTIKPLKAILCMIAVFLTMTTSVTAASSKKEYPGGKYYIWRYTLKDKQGSPYSLDHPGRWLSHKSVERRRRQGLPLDSADLPVSHQYLKTIEKTANGFVHQDKRSSAEWTLIGTSHSIERGQLKVKVHEKWNPWDSIRGEHYGNGRDQIEMLNGQRLHHIGYKGKGMTIAVLDGGFQNCDQISAILRTNILGAEDFVYPRSQHFYRETDHGTKVLSVMAANEPQILVGTAPEARYWLLRCEDQQTEQPVEEDYWTMAAEFADSAGVDIISSSLGYNEYDNHLGDYRLRDLDGKTALISQTASMLASKGIILINSAGNLGMGPWKKITFPADANDILTVGAVNYDRKNAPFCGVGPTQDGRVKPDVMALGSPASLISGRGTIIRDMGTSFSTPIVAGLVACLWQALPDKTALEIINLVRQTSSQYQEPDNIYGYGIPNFWRAYMIGKTEVRGEK